MKFIQLFGFVAFLIPHCLAASAGSNNLRDSDLIFNEQHDLSQAEAYDKVIVGETLKVTCRNGGRLQADVGNCRVDQSVGIVGAHNCNNGKYYYCVVDGAGSCMKIKQAKKFAMESGECFSA